MSLRTAVEKVVDILRVVDKTDTNTIGERQLARDTASRLEMALLASEEEPEFNPRTSSLKLLPSSTPKRQPPPDLIREEASGPSMVRCEGGPFDGDLVNVASSMPADAYTLIGPSRYKMSSDRTKLVYDPVS
jgi:hypothetical protein